MPPLQKNTETALSKMKLIERTNASLLSLRLNGQSAQMLYSTNRLVSLVVS